MYLPPTFERNSIKTKEMAETDPFKQIKGAKKPESPNQNPSIKWGEYDLIDQIDLTKGRSVDLQGVMNEIMKVVSKSSFFKPENLAALGVKLCLEGTTITKTRTMTVSGDQVEIAKVLDILGVRGEGKDRLPNEVTVARIARLFSPLALKTWLQLKQKNRPLPLADLCSYAGESPCFVTVVYTKKFWTSETWWEPYLMTMLMLDCAIRDSGKVPSGSTRGGLLQRTFNLIKEPREIKLPEKGEEKEYFDKHKKDWVEAFRKFKPLSPFFSPLDT